MSTPLCARNYVSIMTPEMIRYNDSTFIGTKVATYVRVTSDACQ